jgi:4-alpha-glucanotransferase
MLLNFYLRFSTQYGQTLFVTGTHALLGQNNIEAAVPLQYFNNEFWHAEVELPEDGAELLDELNYRYVLKNADGSMVMEWGDDRTIALTKTTPREITLLDTWNHAGDVMNAFFTKPFQDVFFNRAAPKPKATKTYTHEFRGKSTLT